MKRSLFVPVAAVALLFTGLFAGPACAVDFTLGFEGPSCGNKVEGQPGEEKIVEVFATLDTKNNTSPDGAQGWSLSVAIDGPLTPTVPPASPITVTVKGVTVQTIYDEDDDGDPGTPPIPHNPFAFDLAGAFTNIAARATLETDPTKLGAISAVVLKSQEKMVLLPNGIQNIMKITLKVKIPDAKPAGPNLKLSYVNGYKSSVSRPVANVVTFNRESITPAFTACEITVTPVIIETEFKLALVPAGKPAAVAGDTVLEETVPAGNVTVPVEVLLTTSNLPPGGDGPQGWSLSIRNDTPCAVITTATVKGVVVSTIYDEDDDGDPGTPPIHHDPFPFDLGGAFTNIATRAARDKANLPANPEGAISAVVLKSQEKMVLHTNATDTILRMNFTVPVTAGQTTDCRIFFEDGLVSSVSRPVTNVITYNRESKSATSSQALRIRLTGGTVAGNATFRHGDPNHDNKFDIADAVRIVMAVVPGIPGGSVLACPAEGDVNDDDLTDLGDAIYYLNWQFKGGPEIKAPFPACATVDGVSTTACPASGVFCP
jgi:hypothetical protein